MENFISFERTNNTDVENFISFERTNNLNHLSDVIVCDATQLISIIRRSP